MITQPPIDKLINIAGCKYALCTVIAKRARYLNEQQINMPESIIKPISQAASELYSGKMNIRND